VILEIAEGGSAEGFNEEIIAAEMAVIGGNIVYAMGIVS
jgi:hypothetical protein